MSVQGDTMATVDKPVIPFRLVEWNVAMSLHTKVQLLAALNPDVAVLPESANTDATRCALAEIGATSAQWVGGNPNKGLSVVTFHGWRAQIDDSYDAGYQWVMPVRIDGPAHVRLLAVWDMNHRGSGHLSARQLGACRASISHYEEFLSAPADLTLISGDFNNSVHWDKPSKKAKFGDFMDYLENRQFISAYHTAVGAKRGSEPHPTLWWMKNATTTYHIDYTFLSRANVIKSVAVGTYADWIDHSDHSPMTIDIDVVAQSNPQTIAVSIGPLDDELRATASTEQLMSPTETADLMLFPLDPGTLPDMHCGVNGQPFVQEFRPTHFTARWTDNVLVEVRIWGPRLLQDGSLGKRELDHRWKSSRAAGGVNYAELPKLVAEQLIAYEARRN
jgi:hypothetical protein